MIRKFWKAIGGDALKRAGRTFLIAFATIEVPGWLGWFHDLTSWAAANGQKPFPDAHNLTYLLVGGVAAGAIAVVNLVVVALEDASGRALWRTPTPPAPPGG